MEKRYECLEKLKIEVQFNYEQWYTLTEALSCLKYELKNEKGERARKMFKRTEELLKILNESLDNEIKSGKP